MKLPPLGAPSSSPTEGSQRNGGLPMGLGPLVICMVAVVAAAFLVVSYSQHLAKCLSKYRRAHQRRFQMPTYSVSTFSHIDSPSISFSPNPTFSHGLDDSVIKTLPLSLYRNHRSTRDCAVCLFELDDDDYVRTLPVCSHGFHVDCIDVWLRSHASCPLCRASVFPFTPLMAARIRPPLDDAVFAEAIEPVAEITPFVDDRLPRRNSMQNFGSYSEEMACSGRALKRSYSFGFERVDPSERMMMLTEPATASPWKLKRAGFWGRRTLTLFKTRVFSPWKLKRAGFWGRRTLTPFKTRVFSSGYYRGGMVIKSPAFLRRRLSGGGALFPWSESFSNTVGWGSSSSRGKLGVSPMFMRSSMAAFSSSRLRCGDPEALLSPERLRNQR